MLADDGTNVELGHPTENLPFWRSRRAFAQFAFGGFTRWSLLVVGLVAVMASSVAIGWWELVDLNQPFDTLLAGLWLMMTGLLAWKIKPSRDIVLVLVGAGGGFLIEWWGTTTELWTYFTGERPPLWIIPAWPVAALATDRLASILNQAFPPGGNRAWRIVYILIIPAFVLTMTQFMDPSWHVTSSHVVLGIMIGVTISTRKPRRDVTLFVMGTALGWFLEYWGTTRECWTYYTQQTPPWITAFAHGFASVAFGQATDVFTTFGAQIRGLLRRGSKGQLAGISDRRLLEDA